MNEVNKKSRPSMASEEVTTGATTLAVGLFTFLGAISLFYLAAT
jgi:hypothetical protein